MTSVARPIRCPEEPTDQRDKPRVDQDADREFEKGAHAADACSDDRRGLAAACAANSASVAALAETKLSQCSAGMLSRRAHERVVLIDTERMEEIRSAPASLMMDW